LGTSTSKRILVADDDPIIRRLIEVNLGLDGFEVETASGGEDALAQAKERSPDLILLDVMMPGITGWEVARLLKEDHETAGIPVVILSARTQDEDRRRGQELGVAGYVSKPFDPQALVELVHRLARDTRA
jgi:DNA-binding response OmpR family regulator